MNFKLFLNFLLGRFCFGMPVMQDTADAGLSALMNTFYTKKALEKLVPMLHFYDNATKSPIPKGAGKIIDMFRFTNPTRVKANLTELTAPTQVGISSARITATLIQRGSYSMIDELVDLTARSPMVDAQVDFHTEEAARTIDGYIADVIGFKVADVLLRSSLVTTSYNLAATGTGVRIYSGSNDGESFPLLWNKTRLATSSTVVGQTKSALSLKAILHAVSYIKAKNALPYADGLYHGFLHPVNEYHLISGTSWKGWTTYTSAEGMRNYNIGVIGGVKFYISTETPKFAISADNIATTSGNIHGTIIVGRGAYGVSEIAAAGQDRGFKMYIKKSDDGNTADPINQKMTVGWKATLVAKVLNKSAGAIIVSTEVA